MSGLPSPQVLSQIVDNFFDTINVWFPILRYSSIAVLLEAYDELSEEDEVLLHAITTTTLRFIPGEILSNGERMRQREYSIRRVKLYVLEHVSMRTLQALVILCVDAFGVDRMPGLLALLRRQYNLLSGPLDYATPRSDGSSPASQIEDPTVNTTGVDSECMESIRQTTHLLQQYCHVITISRSQAMIENPRYTASSPPGWTGDFMNNNRAPTGRGEVASLVQQSDALDLFSRVMNFSQVSFANYRVAAQKEWRKEYAGLHRTLERKLGAIVEETGNAWAVEDASINDKLSPKAVHLAASISLHSTAIHMFKDLGWNAQLAIDQWRLSLARLYDLIDKVHVNSLSPALAFCLWTTCRTSMPHGCFFDNHVTTALLSFAQILQSMGFTWSLAKLYADQYVNAFGAMPLWSPAEPVKSDQESLFTMPSPPESLIGCMDPTFQSSPADTVVEDEQMLYSCFDFRSFETESRIDSAPSCV